MHLLRFKFVVYFFPFFFFCPPRDIRVTISVGNVGRTSARGSYIHISTLKKKSRRQFFHRIPCSRWWTLIVFFFFRKPVQNTRIFLITNLAKQNWLQLKNIFCPNWDTPWSRQIKGRSTLILVCIRRTGRIFNCWSYFLPCAYDWYWNDALGHFIPPNLPMY